MFSNILVYPLIGLVVLCVGLGIALKVQGTLYESLQVAHKTLENEYSDYVKESNQRVEQIQSRSARASDEGKKVYQQALVQIDAQKLSISKLIKENETLNKRTVSNEFVSVFNRTADSGSRTTTKEETLTDGTGKGTHESSPGTGEDRTTEAEALQVIKSNEAKHFACIAQVKGLQQWVNDVCDEVGCK